MAKLGCTRKRDGQNRVPPSTLVPGRHRIGQRPPRPDSGRISNGSTRFWLLTPPSATRFQSHLPDYGRAVRPAAHTRTRTRRRVIASSRDAAGHFYGRRGRACGRTLTSLFSLYVMRGIFSRNPSFTHSLYDTALRRVSGEAGFPFEFWGD